MRYVETEKGKHMSFVILSGMPGVDTETTMRDYREATEELRDLAGSDRAYEDVMNGLAYVDGSGHVIYLDEE